MVIEVSQTQALFNEIGKLIENHGLPKAIIKIKSINNVISSKDIDIYEFIILKVAEVFGVTEKALFNSVDKFDVQDARRTAYILIYKNLNYSHKAIAIQFNKTRQLVSKTIADFEEMQKDTKMYQDYLNNHNLCEKLVKEFINKGTFNPLGI